MTLASIHAILAGVLKTPELDLSATEAKELAKAVGAVQEQYPSTLDPKLQAWVSLGLVGAAIYGPRMMAVRARRGQERQAAPARSTQAQNSEPQNSPRPSETTPTNRPLTPSQMFGPGFSG